ncbi:MAG TPA: M20/M25/M40 family metallo-hydrolase [Patescibacteria group bacterium]|nr:M20/M25/M40 family metallo-hydrolase [Patescibacteria group bacterium]
MKFEEELLRQFISIPSITGSEEKIGLYLYDLLEKEGFGLSKIFVDEKRFNIIAKVGRPKVYLQAHIDTVPPYISFSEDSEFIYGRGACDTKSSIAGMITAAINSKKEGKNNFGLIFTIGEEITFDGAKKIVETEMEIPFVIVGEPTSLQIVNAHFGILVFKIIAKGKSAHSSKPEEGINAIELLLLSIEKINKIKIHRDTILTLAQINGGVADNIIPGEATAVYSMRVSPDDNQNYIEKIKSILPQNVLIEETINVASVSTKVPKELSFIKRVRTVKYFTELSFFQKGVIIGPGDIAYAHGPDEKLSKKELSESVKIYSQIIKNFTE